MLDVHLLRERIAFIRRGGEVERYHTERTLHENTVAEHSFNVAWLCSLMAVNLDDGAKYRLLLAAMTHDLPEESIGDMPAPSKRRVGRAVFDSYEQSLLTYYALSYKSLLTAEMQRILKLADVMEGAFYCIGEAALGNRRIDNVFKNFREYISELNPSSPVELAIVDYIDELWSKYDEHQG